MTVRNFKNVLGAVNDLSVLQVEQPFALAPLAVNEGLSGLLGFDVGLPDGPVIATSVLATFLKRLKDMGETYINGPVTDVVVAVPTWFGDANRQAVLDACNIADLGCLRVIAHSTATALDYGLFRSNQFEVDKPQVVAFMDLGYGSATVTVVEYLPSQLTVLAVVEDSKLGGRSLDKLIAEAIAADFQQKTGLDCRRNVKAWLKVEEAAEKAKKVLSANREAGVHMECFLEDHDLDFSLNREQFEGLCGEYKTALNGLCRRAVESAQRQPSSIEICGGCTRIPFVQATLEAVFQQPISKTVSADECVARGAAIMGAMLDRRHRVKEFKVVDKRWQSVLLSLENPTVAQSLKNDDQVDFKILQNE